MLQRRNIPVTIDDGRCEIAVIGGGFTGSAAAIACLAHIQEPFRLTIVEPCRTLGRGVAFGAHHPLLLLNVRTRDLSVRPGQPGDFLNWAFRQLDQGENHAGLHDGLAHTFLPRQLFGEYVRQRLFEAAAQRPDVELRVVSSVAESCSHTDEQFVLPLANGDTVRADQVILATAYGVQDASTRGALSPFEVVPSDVLSQARTIALIGSGLTMVDTLMSARRSGFQGKVLIVSRRGQFPRPHAARGVVPEEIGLPRSKRISGLTGSVRIACEAAEVHGTPWQAIINGLRPIVPELWRGLSVAEQARFLRHVRPFWNAHRHRLPIEVHATLRAELAAGDAELVRAKAVQVERGPDGYVLSLRHRGKTELEPLTVDLAFDCSGHRPDLASPLIESLIAQDLAHPDPHGLGLKVTPDGKVEGRNGTATPGLFALGPLCQGTLWEITAVPEIVAQADRAAHAVAARVTALEPSLALTP